MDQQNIVQDGGVVQVEQLQQVVEAEAEYEEREIYELEMEEEQTEHQNQQLQQPQQFQEEQEFLEEQEFEDEEDDELELEQQTEEDYEMDMGNVNSDNNFNDTTIQDNNNNTSDNNTVNNQQQFNHGNVNKNNNNNKRNNNQGGGRQEGYYWPKHKFIVVTELLEFVQSKGGSVDVGTFQTFLTQKKIQNLVKKRLRKVVNASGGELVWDKQANTVSLKKSQNQIVQQQKKGGAVNKPKGGKVKEEEDYNWHAINQMVLDYLGTGGVKSVGEVLDYLYQNIQNPGKVDLYKFLKGNKNVKVTKHYVELSQAKKIVDQRSQKRAKDVKVARQNSRFDKRRQSPPSSRRRQSSPPPRYQYQQHPHQHPYQQEENIYQPEHMEHPYQKINTYLPQSQQQQFQHVQAMQQIQQMDQPVQVQQFRPQIPQQLSSQQMNAQLDMNHQVVEPFHDMGRQQSVQYVVDQNVQMAQRQPIQPVLQVGNMEQVQGGRPGVYGQVINTANIQGQVIQLPNGDMYIVKGNQDNNML